MRPHPLEISQLSLRVIARGGSFLLTGGSIPNYLEVYFDELTMQIESGLRHAFLADLGGPVLRCIGLFDCALQGRFRCFKLIGDRT